MESKITSAAEIAAAIQDVSVLRALLRERRSPVVREMVGAALDAVETEIAAAERALAATGGGRSAAVEPRVRLWISIDYLCTSRQAGVLSAVESVAAELSPLQACLIAVGTLIQKALSKLTAAAAAAAGTSSRLSLLMISINILYSHSKATCHRLR